MKKTAPITFAGSRLAECRHVCAFFNDDEEAYRVLLPFITDGFRCNHKAVHVVNPGQDLAHRQRLTTAGIDLARAEQAGQFELKINSDIYLRDGSFDPDRMAPHRSTCNCLPILSWNRPQCANGSPRWQAIPPRGPDK